MVNKKLFQSLRVRLAFWNTLVVLLVVLTAFLTLREGTRLTLVKETRQLLRDEATELALAVENLYPDLDNIEAEFERKVLSHSQNNWFAQLLDENGGSAWRSQNFPQLPGNDDFDSQQAGKRSQIRFVADNFVVRRLAMTGDGTKFTVVLGSPARHIRKDMRNFTKLMLAISAGLILVAPMGGYLLARNATQGVRKIITTTRSLDPSRLDQRLEIRGIDDELDQISVEINSFLDQILKYLRSHREFIANAAHELRSPLTAIQTSVEVSLGKERTSQEYREQLETISEQCARLRHLVNQLLELAESDTATQTADFQSVPLTQLIRQSSDFFAVVAEEKNISLELNLQPDVFLDGDESKIRQVINNLLDNALKFTPLDGRVGIELLTANEATILKVRDSGPGVPASECERIFDRFYQAEHLCGREFAAGNGLGLSICKSIVEMHRGQITASNIADAGLQVQVIFPQPVTGGQRQSSLRDPAGTPNPLPISEGTS